MNWTPDMVDGQLRLLQEIDDMKYEQKLTLRQLRISVGRKRLTKLVKRRRWRFTH